MHSGAPELAVVIPVGPGDDAWKPLPDRLSGLRSDHEIILSSCATLSEPPAGRPRIRIVHGPAGRARQLNLGVRTSRAPWLWLLHADSRPATDALAAVDAWLRGNDPERAAGPLAWCDLSFAPDGPRLAALNAAAANRRSAWFGLPFGDQGWLLSRSVFDALGGFDEEFGRGEDLDFIVRARRRGVELARLGVRLQTSARRYRRDGWLATTAAHAWLTPALWLRSIRRDRRP